MSRLMHAPRPRSQAAHRRPGTPVNPYTVVVALAVAMTVLLALAVGRPPTVAAASKGSGVSAGGPSVVSAFATWRGRAVGPAHVFAPGATWSDIELPGGFVSYWGKSGYRGKIMLSLPLLPSGGSPTLAQGATGTFNSHFRTAAKRLVANGMGNAIIRLGWEFNGGWFPWAAKGHAGAYAGFYRQVVSTMRSVSGANFSFVWSLSNGYYGWDPRTAYPGDGYVTYVGDGLYDCWWKHPGAPPAQRWNSLVVPPKVGLQAGLAFWTTFAQSHGKQLVLPEWGLVNATAGMCGGGGGGGDDTYFIQRVHDWVGSHPVAFETYFNRDPANGYHRLDTGRFPKAAALYRSLFGGA